MPALQFYANFLNQKNYKIISGTNLFQSKELENKMSYNVRNRYRNKQISENSLQRFQYELLQINRFRLPTIKKEVNDISWNNRYSQSHQDSTNHMISLRREVGFLRKQVTQIILDKQIDDKICKQLMKINQFSKPLYNFPLNQLCYYHKNNNQCSLGKPYLKPFENIINQEKQPIKLKSNPNILKKFRKVGIAVFFVVIFPALTFNIRRKKINQFDSLVYQKQGTQYNKKKIKITQKLKKISLVQIFNSFNPNKGRVSAFMIMDSYKSVKLINSISLSKFRQSQSSNKDTCNQKQIKSPCLELVLHFMEGLLGQIYQTLGTEYLLGNEHFLMLNKKNGSPYYASILSNQQKILLNQNQKGQIRVDEQGQKVLLALFIFGLMINQVLAKIKGVSFLSAKQRDRLPNLEQQSTGGLFQVIQISASFLAVIMQEILQAQILRRKLKHAQIFLFKQLNKKQQVKNLIQKFPSVSDQKQSIKAFIMQIIEQMHMNLQKSYIKFCKQLKLKAIASQNLIRQYNKEMKNCKRRTILRKKVENATTRKRNNLFEQKISKRSIQQMFGSFR